METTLASVPTELLLGGCEKPAASGRRFAVSNPATEDVLLEVADAGPDDAAHALDIAASTQPGWAGTPARRRAELLRRAFELVERDRDRFARLITLEMGKPLPESHAEVSYGAEFLRWFSEEAVRISGRYTTAPSGAGRILVTKQPVGPTLAITPWNFPLAMGTRKIAAAVAAGCTMIVKPAPDTPLTMLLLGKVMAEAGLPDGVLSVLPTSAAAAVTAPMLADPRLRKLTFTGSTAVGKTLLAQAAGWVLRTSMELGGNAPFVVFADVDVGPLINAQQRDKVAELVDDAVGKGAAPLLGARRGDGNGYFYPPTVLTGTPSDARILTEEVFGPVASITGFDGEAEGIAAANATEYGLVAYIYTRDLDSALRVAEAIESGMVGVNRGVISDPAAPFGGIKESGIGREGGTEGIEEYLETKYIALA